MTQRIVIQSLHHRIKFHDIHSRVPPPHCLSNRSNFDTLSMSLKHILYLRLLVGTFVLTKRIVIHPTRQDQIPRRSFPPFPPALLCFACTVKTGPTLTQCQCPLNYIMLLLLLHILDTCSWRLVDMERGIKS